ncbi:hypothetical protein [Nostoc sp. 106C]|uniref:hypothetical protein n=1 Tax=Nostoc sp. 106C TaxID=1932667 RepID=UPI001064B6E8|nr:hypothetical protein [Nostoc sp. 106C]
MSSGKQLPYLLLSAPCKAVATSWQTLSAVSPKGLASHDVVIRGMLLYRYRYANTNALPRP